MKPQVQAALEAQIARGPLYHASRDPLPIGAVLEPLCPKKFGFPPHVEEFIDQHRPEGAVPRDCAMYSAFNKNDLRYLASRLPKHVYVVEPVGKSTIADPGWFDGWNGIRNTFDDNFGPPPNEHDEFLAHQAAKNYWLADCHDLDPDDLEAGDGGDCDHPKMPELLSEGLRIVREDLEGLPTSGPRFKWVPGRGVVDQVTGLSDEEELAQRSPQVQAELQQVLASMWGSR